MFFLGFLTFFQPMFKSNMEKPKKKKIKPMVRVAHIWQKHGLNTPAFLRV